MSPPDSSIATPPAAQGRRRIVKSTTRDSSIFMPNNRLRVLYVINSFDQGGAEHGLLTLIQSGFFHGADVQVLAFCKGRGSLMERVVAALGPAKVGVASDEAALSVAGLLKGAAATWRALRTPRPDLVVLSLKQANVVGRFILGFFPGVRCVSFEHIARYRARRAEGLYGIVLKALSWRVDEVWADCRQTLVETRHYFLGRRKTEQVVPLFCITDSVAPKAGYGLHQPLRVVAAGRLIDRKNFDVLIDALGVLRQRGVAATLDIYGDGPMAQELLGKSTRDGMAETVSLKGYKPGWFELAREADVFVNLSDTEGFCIVVAEAMSVGLPVIATDVGGIVEYGRDGINMLKLPEITATAAAGAIMRLAADESLRQALGEAARADMVEQYSAGSLRRRGEQVLSRGPKP